MMLVSPQDTILVATKHKKEHIFDPLFKKAFGCNVKVIENFDTDTYGTFTGEKKRHLSQRDAAIQKAKDGATISGARFILASEGSFWSDPNTFGLLVGDTELVVLYDSKEKKVYEGWYTTYETCARKTTITTQQDSKEFLEQIPTDQELIISYRSLYHFGRLRFEKEHRRDQIESRLEVLLSSFGVISLTIETDMRAHRNTLRKYAIEKAAEDCITKIQNASFL